MLVFAAYRTLSLRTVLTPGYGSLNRNSANLCVLYTGLELLALIVKFKTRWHTLFKTKM